MQPSIIFVQTLTTCFVFYVKRGNPQEFGEPAMKKIKEKETGFPQTAEFV